MLYAIGCDLIQDLSGKAYQPLKSVLAVNQAAKNSDALCPQHEEDDLQAELCDQVTRKS